MASVTFDITFDAITADMPMVRHNIYKLQDGSKLFFASLGSGIDFIVKASMSRALCEEYYSRKLHLFDRDISSVYLNFLQVKFYRDSDGIYVVNRSTGDGESAIGVLDFNYGPIMFSGQPIETSKSRTLLAKCATLIVK